jgi:hypothetical protein
LIDGEISQKIECVWKRELIFQGKNPKASLSISLALYAGCYAFGVGMKSFCMCGSQRSRCPLFFSSLSMELRKMPFFSVLGFELRAYTLSHLTAHFVEGFFKIGSCALFAWAGFEPGSS